MVKVLPGECPACRGAHRAHTCGKGLGSPRPKPSASKSKGSSSKAAKAKASSPKPKSPISKGKNAAPPKKKHSSAKKKLLPPPPPPPPPVRHSISGRQQKPTELFEAGSSTELTAALRAAAHARGDVGFPQKFPRVTMKLDYTPLLEEQQKMAGQYLNGGPSAEESGTFWKAASARLPASAKYDPASVPTAARDLSGAVLIAPADRIEWFLCLGELMACVEEATRRQAVNQALYPMPTPMPVAYIAQRLDTDDPIWGWQVRDAANGWLQGFITMTTFTTWSADFSWER